MTEIPSKPRVWLYTNGSWHHAPRPDYIRKGEPVARVPYGTEPEMVGLTLWMRDELPQCVIDIESRDKLRAVYVERLPDALDLMARWAPIYERLAKSADPNDDA